MNKTHSFVLNLELTLGFESLRLKINDGFTSLLVFPIHLL